MNRIPHNWFFRSGIVVHFFLWIVIAKSTVAFAAPDEGRVVADLQALYDFSESEGDIVHDQSQKDAPLNLRIADLSAVKWIDGGLEVQKPTIIQTVDSPARLIAAIRNSAEATIEVWCQPNNTKQAGPARLVTVSKNSSERNLTLGQDGDKFEVRLRTTRTSTNGIPSLPTPARTAATNLTHIVFVRDKSGATRVYVNGKQVATGNAKGDLSNWDSSFGLAIANELSTDRPWLGTLHLVAVYSRALNQAEVLQNFSEGANGRPSPEKIAERQHRKAAQFFETSVAPILARHCLECHDSSNHENGLDLSKKVAAFRGGENGKVIIPGQSAESAVWVSVEADSMPHQRTPLSSEDKATLKKWIDDGATWTLTEIDPAIYSHNGTNQNFVQRLTIDEYIETVRSTVGVDIEKEARELLPADLRADGFSNTAYNLAVDLKHVNAYGQLAEEIVSRMDVGQFVKRFSNRRKFTDKDMNDVISKVGKWMLRGPIDEREIYAYLGITTTVASAGGTFDEAMGLVVEAMLQSPRFMYRIEGQRGNGSSVRVNEFELASRLSYIIWGGPPDEELLKAADEGRLTGEDVVEQASRMLQDPKAVQQSLRFVSDWLNLNRLQNLSPDVSRFPKWNRQLAQDMRLETLAYFEDVVWAKKLPLSALLNSQVTFASPALATFYGLSQPTGEKSRHEFARYDLSQMSGRGGLLTQGSVLTVGGDDASMVTRGLLVMHELLRGVVKDPPPCVDTTPIPTKPGLTQRSIAMQRITNATCGGCHSKFEPLAFGLEKFNGIGDYHDVDEHGNKLLDDGEILFPGAAAPVKYRSSAELMDLLASSDRVSQSLSWKVIQFALGRPLVAEDAALVDKVHEQSRANGGTWTSLMVSLVSSDLVQKTRTESARIQP